MVLALSFGAPWLAERHLQYATTRWQTSPADAFRHLDSAAKLDPLSPDPELVAATIALQVGRPQQAVTEFREALDRDPRETYALLELGVLTVDAGDRTGGLAMVERAHALDPRNNVTTGVLRKLQKGRKVDLSRVNATFLARSRVHLRPRR
jgi:protein O-GlcNAc transferase